MADPKLPQRETLLVVPGASGNESPTVNDRPGGARPSDRTTAFDPPEDRFEPRSELGRGGMGRVVEAFDRALGRTVAVKHMLSDSEVDVARFEREAQITARLEHPGIVAVHDAGRSPDGTPYYVMRRIDGEPLEKLVAGRTFAERVTLVPNVLAACDATAYAHARKVIHRDIKPSNILIGPFGETLLIDWGLARTIGETDDGAIDLISDSNLTRAGTVAGTPGFMAPEQARGEILDARADVFALGATLFFVLAGDQPYAVNGPTEMIAHAGANRPPDWRRLPADTPGDLRAVVVKAMATDPADRYADAGELAADLRSFVTGKLVGAYRYGRVEQLRRFVRRHRAAMAVASIALVVILAGGFLSIRRIVTERDDARSARELAETKRREATEKSDELLVQNAQHLVDLDPAAAIVALRRLSVDSKEWPRAAVIAEAAASRGIPFGFHVEDRASLIAISPASTRVFVLPRQRQVLMLFDLIGRKRLHEITVGDLLELHWLDERWLLGLHHDSLVLVDTQNGAARTIPSAVKLKRIVTDGASHGLVISEAGQVFAVDATTTTLGAPVLEDVDEVAILTPTRWIVQRGGRIDLWTPRERITLPGTTQTANTALVVGGTRVGAVVDDNICVWDVTTTPEQLGCTPWLRQNPLGFIGNDLVLTSPQGVSLFSELGLRPFRKIVAVSFGRSGTGILYSTVNGGIEGFDAQGFFRISRQPTAYQRMTQSADGRFVVATTTTGELLAWDLPTFRPSSQPIPMVEKLSGITPDAVWTHESMNGVFRYDRRTNEKTEVLNGMFSEMVIDASDRWVLGIDILGQIASIYDPVTGRATGTRAGESLSVSGDLVLAQSGSQLLRVNTDGSRTQLADLGSTITGIGVVGNYVVAALGSQVCRITISTGHHACVPIRLESSDAFAIDPYGTIWMTQSRQLVRWKLDGSPEEIATPSRVAGFFARPNDTLIAFAHNAFLRLDTDPPVAVAIRPMDSFQVATDRRIIARTPQGRLAAIDIETGLSYELPHFDIAQQSAARAHNNTFGALVPDSTLARHVSLRMWTFNVPHEPAALREWLMQSTNATPAPGADIVAWP